MRVRTPSTVTALLLMLSPGCRQAGGPADALALLADSVAVRGAEVRCVPDDDVPWWGTATMRLCEHSRAETTVAIRRTAVDGAVQMVARRWRPLAPLSEAYADMVRRFDALHGTGQPMCLEPAEPPVGMFWQTASFHVTLHAHADSGQLDLAFRRGRPRYALSCSGRR